MHPHFHYGRYNVTITQYLYEKSMANNYTVFAYVMDSIIHQEHKEALLAYFFLWNHGANSIGDLDEEIERFLARLNEVGHCAVPSVPRMW